MAALLATGMLLKSVAFFHHAIGMSAGKTTLLATKKFLCSAY